MSKISISNQRTILSLSCDIAVVGAGPAGAAAAYHLASSGLDVVLLDQQQFPRDKTCGDFVGPIGLRELKILGITSSPKYRKTNVINEASIYIDGKKLISRSIPWVEGLPDYGRVIPRLLLDNWLLNSARDAGARILTGVHVIGCRLIKNEINISAESPEGQMTINAKLLIGADGSNSFIAKSLRDRLIPRESHFLGVRGYFDRVECSSDEACIYFNSESFPGYSWLFPTGEHTANIGTVVLVDSAHPNRCNPKELLSRIIEDDISLHGRIRNARQIGKVTAWPLAIYNPKLPVVGNNVILIGDAAGLTNPINCQGIQYALLSARWASETVQSCFSEGDFSAQILETYSKKIEKELRYDFAISNFIVQLIRNRNLTPVWLRTLEIIASKSRIDPDYAQLMGGILLGLLSPSEAMNFGIIRGTVEHAALSTGFKTILDVLRGPSHLSNVGMNTIQTGFKILYKTFQNPAFSLKWGLDSMVSISELALQAVKHPIEEE